MQNYKWARDLL
jgi:ATP-dependent RNA helicase DDX18/HAS1